MDKIVELNRDGTLPRPPYKEPEMTATTVYLPTLVFKKVNIRPNPKYRWWKFWEDKELYEFVQINPPITKERK